MVLPGEITVQSWGKRTSLATPLTILTQLHHFLSCPFSPCPLLSTQPFLSWAREQ